MRANQLNNNENCERGLEHRLEMSDRREAFRVARAMGICLSTAKLAVLAFTEVQWPIGIAIGKEDLCRVSNNLKPPSPELITYINHVNGDLPAASAGVARPEESSSEAA